MRSWVRLALVGLLLVSACADDETGSKSSGGPTAPTPPAPTLRANLTPFGNFRWQDCVSSGTPSCTFVAALSNTGPGCAIRVEGTVRLFEAHGLQVGTSYHFVLPPQQIVGPREQVPYFVSFVPVDIAQLATDYTVTPVWVDTPCF
jgi:hypothetical protein